MSPPTTDVGDLCTSCGLCCDGTLFLGGTLTPDEASLVARGLLAPVGRGDGDPRPGFSQPCRAFAGQCTIYDERPAACRRFRCALLKAREAGEIALDEALAQVRMGQALAARVRLHLPAGRPAWQLCLEAIDALGGAATMNPQAMVDALALTDHLDRHFRVDGDHRLETAPRAGGDL